MILIRKELNMPTYLKATAVPESLLKLEPVLKGLVVAYTTMTATRFIDHLKEIDERAEEMFAELHEALDLQPVLDMSRIVSIQVQTTKLTGAGVEVVSYKGTDATHWSIYTRTADGIATWVKDIAITKGDAAFHYGDAVVTAAKLSMEHQAFIEQVK